jgi:Dimerisation domain
MLHENDPQNHPPTAAVTHLIMGFRTTQIIYAAAKLGIADLLKDGPQDASAMASVIGLIQELFTVCCAR